MLDSIKDFKVFKSIYETLSLTESSELFNTSPATMSKKLAAIERDVGEQLFYRSTRSISPTQYGHELYSHTLDFLGRYHEIFNEEQLRNIPKGNLRITISASLYRGIFVEIINEFLNKYPQISLELNLSDQVVDIVDKGFDMALRVSDLPDSNLMCVRLADSTRVLCASKEYIQIHGKPKKPSDLKDHNCLILNNERVWKFKKEKKKISVVVKGNIKTNFGDLVVDYLKRDQGIAFVAKWHISNELKNHSVVPLLPSYVPESNPSIFIVFPHVKKVPARTRIFIDFLKDKFKV
jgi:DNA-binding transcriptional LysR family regulator